MIIVALYLKFYLILFFVKLFEVRVSVRILSFSTADWILYSPVTISLFPTSIDLDPIFDKDRDLDRFRFSYRVGRSVGHAKYFRRAGRHPISYVTVRRHQMTG